MKTYWNYRRLLFIEYKAFSSVNFSPSLIYGNLFYFASEVENAQERAIIIILQDTEGIKGNTRVHTFSLHAYNF